MVYGGTVNKGYTAPANNQQYQGGRDATGKGFSGTGITETHSGIQQMGKGSKTPAMPAQPSPMDTATASNWLEQQKFNREQSVQKAKDAKALADKKAQEATTAGDVSRMYGQGQQYGASQLGNLGFGDTYGIMDRYNTALSNAKSNVPKSATDVGQYFNTNNMWQNAINEATTAQRGKLNTEYTNFAKPGWQQGQYGFADTSDDAILASIMGEQRQGTQDTLKGNLARGQMSQGAYDYALNQMKNQEDVGMSNLQGIGGGVLGGYRDKLSNTANQYNDRLTNYQLGQNMSLADLQGQLGSQQASLGGGMRGDILKAMGDTKLFDLEKLISSAGVATGAGNTPLAQAIGGQQQAGLVDPNRTTGTTGIF